MSTQDNDTYGGFPERFEAALEQSRRDLADAAPGGTPETIEAEEAFERCESAFALCEIERLLRLCADPTGNKVREEWKRRPDWMSDSINDSLAWMLEQRRQLARHNGPQP